MKTRNKQRKSASNQSAIVQGYFKGNNPIKTKTPSINDLRQQKVQDILNKIKKR